MKLDKTEKRSILIFVIIFILLSLVLVYTVLTWRRDNTQEFVSSISKEDRIEKGENNEDIDIFVAMTQKESWPGTDGEGRSTIGAEYDGVIFNNSGKNIVGWTMTIYMPKNKNGEPINGTFDSSWNGEYTNNGDNIYFEPADYLNVIPKGEEKTYGFVMYAGTNLDFSEFEIRGYYQTILPEYPGFWICSIGYLVWLTWVAAWLVMDARARKLKKQKEHDEKIIEETMQVFANFIDAKDEYTRGHSTRVAFYSQRIAKRMGMSDEDIKMIGYLGLMHDCGKIAIPDDVLNKKGPLTEEEREIIKEHTTRGGQMLQEFTSIPGIRDGALYHHERYDGKGYPKGLVGKNIPLYARIINVADAFDAMNSDRCYRKRLSKSQILFELRNNAGTQFDPEIVEYMISMYQEGKV